MHSKFFPTGAWLRSNEPLLLECSLWCLELLAPSLDQSCLASSLTRPVSSGSLTVIAVATAGCTIMCSWAIVPWPWLSRELFSTSSSPSFPGWPTQRLRKKQRAYQGILKIRTKETLLRWPLMTHIPSKDLWIDRWNGHQSWAVWRATAVRIYYWIPSTWITLMMSYQWQRSMRGMTAGLGGTGEMLKLL